VVQPLHQTLMHFTLYSHHVYMIHTLHKQRMLAFR